MISLTCWLSGGDAIRMLEEYPSLRISVACQVALRHHMDYRVALK